MRMRGIYKSNGKSLVAPSWQSSPSGVFSVFLWSNPNPWFTLLSNPIILSPGSWCDIICRTRMADMAGLPCQGMFQLYYNALNWVSFVLGWGNCAWGCFRVYVWAWIVTFGGNFGGCVLKGNKLPLLTGLWVGWLGYGWFTGWLNKGGWLWALTGYEVLGWVCLG